MRTLFRKPYVFRMILRRSSERASLIESDIRAFSAVDELTDPERITRGKGKGSVLRSGISLADALMGRDYLHNVGRRRRIALDGRSLIKLGFAAMLAAWLVGRFAL